MTETVWVMTFKLEVLTITMIVLTIVMKVMTIITTVMTFGTKTAGYATKSYCLAGKKEGFVMTGFSCERRSKYFTAGGRNISGKKLISVIRFVIFVR